MNTANRMRMMGLAVIAAVALLAGGEAWGAINTYLVGSSQTYTTIQSALNAARTGGAATDTQIVRIMDSASYATENLVLTGSWSTRKLILEANAGQTPTLFAITLAQTIGEVTLKDLKFRSPLASTTINGAVVITQNGGTLTAPITITNCNFEQTGNAAGAGWLNGVYIRASASGTYGKVTVASCNFDMTAGTVSLVSAGVNMPAVGGNYANVEVKDCVFLGGYYGVFDDNETTLTMSALNIHNNLFHSQNYVGSYHARNISHSYLTIENNTFVKIYDRHNGYESGGAINLRNNVTFTGVIKNNLIVDDMASTHNAGITWLSTVPTECNADYNAFVAMTANKVAYWNSALKTISDLNGLTSASGNFEKNADGSAGDPTLANLFANYGGTDYRNDYRLKVGVWALTAASDSSYVGAFGQQLPVVTVTANDNTATEAGPTTGQFTVSRGTRTDGALAVNFALSGSATPGGDPNDYTLSFSGVGAVDYTAKTGSVTIANGATDATVTVTPFNDTEVESDETVVLTLSSQAGYTVGSPSSNTVTITSDDSGNLAPIVNAGTSQTVVVNTLPTGNVTLNGSATDDGQLAPMTYQWSKQSGLGTVTFPGGATITNTTATFDAAGAYVLQLVAYDGGLYGTGTVTVTVYTNSAPVVEAGSDQTASLASTVNLAGSLMTDDGLPAPPPAVAYAWSKASGVGTVTFGNSTNLATTATFSQLDTYVLRLVATDGLGLSGTDTVTVTVRDVATFTAVTNASFNAASTWTPGGGPPLAGDTAVITDKTVTASNSAHIVGGTIVNVSGSGNLTLAASGGTWSGFTVNVLTGGTWWVRTGNTIQTTVTATLDGGRLYLEGLGSPIMNGQVTVASASTVEISSGGYPAFNPIAYGTGTLTVAGGSVDGRTEIGLAAGSTWTGAWNIACTGSVRSATGTQITNNFARGLRLGPVAALSSVNGGTPLLPGTLTGSGELTGFQTHTWTIGSGGTLSPGDAGVSNGAGNLKCSSSSNYNATLVFASNSTYRVDIAGTTTAQYDCVTVRDTGNGAGTGIVQILTGAKLDVTLWKAPANTNVNVTIIDLPAVAQGSISGNFAVTWHTTNGWSNLAVYTNNNDLVVTGEYTFVNNDPVISPAGPVTVNMNEDGGTLSLTNLNLSATDADGDAVTWTNVNQPANGVVAVNGAGTNPTWTVFTYTPTPTNYNGTNTFEVKAYDVYGGAATVTVQVVVDPVNDAPVNTAIPTVSGLFQTGQTVSNDYPGAWNDAVDTNVSGSSILVFTRQWQWATNGVGGGATNFLNETNDTYAVTGADTGRYVSVRVTCTDDGVGSGSPQSATTNSVWTLVTVANALPVITNGNGTLVVSLAEDCGATNLLAVLNLGATDADSGQQDTLVWTNMTGSAYGAMTVSGTGSNPAAITYTPNADWNGTNTFTVRVTDTVGGFDEIGVEVRVAAVNDAPVCTATGTISGPVMVGSNLTVTAGTWNDNIDINVSGSSTLTLSRQWKRNTSATAVGVTDIAGATALTYTLTELDRGKYLGVLETCVDTGVGGPGPLTNTVYSGWLQETSPVPGVVVFSNALDTTWGSYPNWKPTILPTTNITAVIGDTAVLSPATVDLSTGAQAARNLFLGTNANSSGTLNMTGGTLTFPGNGNITVAGAAGSTGTLNQTGGTIGGITNGNLSIAAGVDSVGAVILGGDSAITSTWSVASGTNSSGTLTLTNSASWKNGDSSPSLLGNAGGAIGRLKVCGEAMMNFYGTKAGGSSGPRSLTLGAVAGSTGEVTVIGNGVITNVGTLAVGNPGYGTMTVGGGVVWARQIDIGSTNNNSVVVVKDTGRVVTPNEGNGSVRIGALAGASGTLAVTNDGVMSVANYDGNAYSLIAGYADASEGRINVCGGTLAMTGRKTYLGVGVGSTGILEITSGVFSNAGAAYVFTFGATNNAVGELDLRGGKLYSQQDVAFGAAAGALGRAFVTGGDWQQVGALNVGTVAGGTGLVTVANCTSATNITGAVTVGGAGYGLLTISNATFGGSTAVTVTNGGNVEVTGMGSIFRVNTLAVKNGGAVTNYLRLFAGGVDITNNAATSLVITNGGKMHLVFEVRPGRAGDFWGLRWAGNRTNELAAMTNTGDLTWGGDAATGVGIYTNATHTMVGYVAQDSGTTFRFR